MKKIFSFALATSMILTCSTAVLAADTTATQTLPGDVVTITVAQVPTTTTSFTYTPSPNVGIEIVSNATNYAIQAANAQTDTVNGVEYGTLSTSAGYAQRTKTTAAGSAATNGPKTPTATALEGANWGWVGGS